MEATFVFSIIIPPSTRSVPEIVVSAREAGPMTEREVSSWLLVVSSWLFDKGIFSVSLTDEILGSEL